MLHDPSSLAQGSPCRRSRLWSRAPCRSSASIAVPTHLLFPTMWVGSCRPQRCDGSLDLLLDHVRSLPVCSSSVLLSVFDYIALQPREKGQHFVPFGHRHSEFLQHGAGVSHKHLPVTGAHTQTFVGGLHVTTRVEDRSPRGRAHIVDEQLAVPSETVLAVAFPKYAELWIIAQPCEELVRDRGNGIIATQAGIQRCRLHGVSSCELRSACHTHRAPTRRIWTPDGVCAIRRSTRDGRRADCTRCGCGKSFGFSSILFQFLCMWGALGDAHATRVLPLRRAGVARPGQRTPVVRQPGTGPAAQNLRPPPVSGGP